MHAGCCRRLNAMCLNRKTELKGSSMNPNLTILAIFCVLDDRQRARANFRLSLLVFREDHDDSDDDNSTVFKLNTINFLVSLIFPCLRSGHLIRLDIQKLFLEADRRSPLERICKDLLRAPLHQQPTRSRYVLQSTTFDAVIAIMLYYDLPQETYHRFTL